MMSSIPNPTVFVVLSHYNQLNDTLECLKSLSLQDYQNIRIILVDNGSSPDDIYIIQKNYPDCLLISIPENIGFSGGYNTGIQEALLNHADFIFIISNDTILNHDVISLLVSALHSTQSGAAVPLIYHHAQPEKIWSAGGLVNNFSLHMVDNHGRNKTFSEIVERDFITGCAVMFRSNLLKVVGGFDEQFISFFEDADLSYRIKKQGFKSILVPKAKIWHKVSRSFGGSLSPSERYFMARGYMIFLKKHLSSWKWLFIPPWIIYVYIKNTIILLMNKKYFAWLAYNRGMLVGFFSKLNNQERKFF